MKYTSPKTLKEQSSHYFCVDFFFQVIFPLVTYLHLTKPGSSQNHFHFSLPLAWNFRDSRFPIISAKLCPPYTVASSSGRGAPSIPQGATPLLAVLKRRPRFYFYALFCDDGKKSGVREIGTRFEIREFLSKITRKN